MAYITNSEVFGLETSIIRSGYPMLLKQLSKEEFLSLRKDIGSSILEFEKNRDKSVLYCNKHIKRAIQLANADGGGHDQFLTGIVVNFDLTLTNKAWVEAERYTFLNFISSFSTMHRISAMPVKECCDKHVDPSAIELVEGLQKYYNEVDGEKEPEEKREAYLNLLYNLPSGFELTAGMTTNYRCLKNIYAQRRNHRLPDWHVVCDWIESLPLAGFLITGKCYKRLRTDTKVVCISGKARAGKDATGRLLRDILVERGKKVLIAHYADLVKYVCKSVFGWNGEKDMPGRELLQRVGTDVVRKKDQNYWVDFVASIIKFFPDEWDYVIIPDTRFPNELTRLSEYYGLQVVHMRITRPGFDNGLPEAQKLHPSETALDNSAPDISIINHGSMDDLKKMVSESADMLLSGKG